ncbi:unnamed protein product [Gadus morhua 'NCC']
MHHVVQHGNTTARQESNMLPPVAPMLEALTSACRRVDPASLPVDYTPRTIPLGLYPSDCPIPPTAANLTAEEPDLSQVTLLLKGSRLSIRAGVRSWLSLQPIAL